MGTNTTNFKVENLTKRFGSFLALDDVSISFDQGDVFCLLGPNGSGKTTLINCILGLLKPENGLITFWGYSDSLEIKKKVGVVLEEDGFFRDLSVEKNIKIVCLIKNASMDEALELLENLSLIDHRKKMVKKLSQGMRKRLAIACSLVGNPDLLIWDEPYNGLDPTGFQFMRNLIRDLKMQGKTIMISTHLLDEVKKTASRVGLISEGRVKALSSIENIDLQYESMDDFYLQHVPY